MSSMPVIPVQRTDKPRSLPTGQALGFGKHFTDHMFLMEYKRGEGWINPRIIPYHDFQMAPSASVFHYAQALFEGMKAFKTHDGKSVLFRAKRHAQRMANSTARMSMPEIDPEWIRAGIEALVRVDRDWIPEGPDAALYLRPTLIANEGFLGVKPADSYYFFVIASPVGSYYGDQWSSVRIWVEDEHVRAAPGGLGAVKAAANYVASLAAAASAKARGYAQVLWLDAIHRKYLEEVGTMNLFVRIGDRLITPPLEGGTILAGVTRDTVLALARDWKITCEERMISFDELKAAHAKGELKEVFGTGTAAVVTPVGELGHRGGNLIINDGRVGEWSQRFYDHISRLQRGLEKDTHEWLSLVE